VRSSFGMQELTLMQVLELVSGQLKVSRVYPLEVENADLESGRQVPQCYSRRA
jgi:hypothetical protein